jgi:RNA polymerase sigma-70 factor (ECF subfamily)
VLRFVEDIEGFVWAARGGDRAATQALFTALLPRVRNLVRFLVRGDADIDDISQEALVAIIRGLGSFRADGTLKSWVDRVVVRATFAFIRKRRREPASSRNRLDLLDSEATVTAQPDDYLSRRRAVAALDELPLEQRHAIVLHHVLEMSVPEIADQLDMPAETVRSRLRLARAKLRGHGIVTPPLESAAGDGQPGARGEEWPGAAQEEWRKT